MKTPKIILFRAKRIDNGKWIEGYYCNKKSTTYCFKEDYKSCPVKTEHYIIQETMTDWGMPNKFIIIEIDPTTLSQFTGWVDRYGKRIFENDIVEMVSSPKSSYKYLIWWNKEMNCMEAIDFRGINFNGNDYYNCKNLRDYETFCLMMQDPWGDFQDIKVIGNVFDNYDIVEEALNE